MLVNPDRLTKRGPLRI